MMRTRPGRSVTKRRPSGANAIDHGISRPVTTDSTVKRTPSVVVNTSAAGAGAGVSAGAGEGAGSGFGVGESQALVVATCVARTSANTPPRTEVHMAAIL